MAATEDELILLYNQLGELKADKKGLQAEKDLHQADIARINAEIDSLNLQIQSVKDAINAP